MNELEHKIAKRQIEYCHNKNMKLSAKLFNDLIKSDKSYSFAEDNTFGIWIPYELKASMSIELIQDMKMLHGINIEDEVLKVLLAECYEEQIPMNHLAYIKIQQKIDPNRLFPVYGITIYGY